GRRGGAAAAGRAGAGHRRSGPHPGAGKRGTRPGPPGRSVHLRSGCGLAGDAGDPAQPRQELGLPRLGADRSNGPHAGRRPPRLQPRAMSAPTASLTLLANTRVSNGWRLLRLAWPHPAPGPGQWLGLRAAGQVVRLPVSHASSRENWLALLAPPPLASALADWAPQSRLEVDGPRGPALQPCAEPPVLLAADAGIPAALFFVETAPVKPRLALLGGRLPPPFRPVPTQFMLAGLPPEAIAAAPMLEAQAVPSRLAQA